MGDVDYTDCLVIAAKFRDSYLIYDSFVSFNILFYIHI